MTTPRIAVFGCGPAGLIAAQTAREHGAEVAVFSQPGRSYIAGAQYLHSSVPGVHAAGIQQEVVLIDKRGTQDGYAQKVYGDPNAPVSWERYQSHYYPAWNMRALYDALWGSWGGQVVPTNLTPAIAAQAASEGRFRPDGGDVREGHFAVDAIVSTVPLVALCRTRAPALGAQHGFIDQTVHILQQEGREADHPSGADNFIIYNGEKNPAWYRMSYLFGSAAYEWSDQTRRPPIDGVVTIRKPLATNCDCFQDTDVPFVLAGRYGTWNKNGLVHDVVATTQGLLKGLF